MEHSRKALNALPSAEGLIFPSEMCETLEVLCVRVGRGEVTAPAAHPDEEEVYVVLSGSGVVRLDGVPHPVGVGSVVYIPRFTQHIIEGTGEDGLMYVCVANWPDKPAKSPEGK